RKPVGGVVSSVKNFPNRTTVFNESFDIAGNLDTSSYDFEIVITDSFGNKTSSMGSVSTAKLSLSIRGDKGVDIGKVHERGELAVAGESVFDGPAEFLQKASFEGGVEARVDGAAYTSATDITDYPPGLSTFDTAHSEGWPNG